MTKVYDTATDIITFARGSSATYLDSDGIIKTAATDAPRIEYAEDGTLKGLLIEEQRTNLLHNTDNPPTQVANLTAGSHTLSFVGGPSTQTISDSITANAVDVFVYDTKRDSDGGAWRTGSRAQASSWYNETLNTNIRGSRREFPEVAVIVAEAAKVTIYDGDDPSLPMWMVFNAANTNNLLRNAGALSVVMTNAQLVVATAQAFSSITVFQILFAADSALGRNPSGVYEYTTNLAGRNSGVNGYTLLSGSGAIINPNVNDVAMTVLPDAPIDPDTGLPVPTIAVATDGGVSVIKDDGMVVDIHDGSSITGWVDFTDDGEIFFNEGGAVTAVNSYVGAIPSADVTNLTSNFQRYRYDQAPYLSPVQALDGAIAAGGNLVYRKDGGGAAAGLSILAPLPTNPTGGLVAAVTSSYTTGWMNGDIKLAALADTTAETLSGSDLVVEGSHAGIGSDWSYASGTYSSAGSQTSGQNLVQFNGIGSSDGKVYSVSLDIANRTTGSLGVRFNTGSPASFNTNGTHTATLTGTSNDGFQLIEQGGFDGDVSNIVVRLADPDRSINGNGLAVHGSITKAAVATGADVVAYSGFNSSNYLEQPYNADLDFGQGDFCVMGWVNLSSTGYGGIAHLSSEKTATSNNGFGLFYTPTLLLGYVSGNTQQAQASRPQTGAWEHVCFLRRDGALYLYQNGNQTSSAANNRSASPTDTTANLLVGGYYQGFVVAASNDKLALIRISATAPTADQIAKIYNDEKLLFQPNAKATLDGTSDAVTALAHDPETDLLHVGTNQSRSVFYGLRRINQTGNAVTTAISAVDGLISEQ